MHMKGQKILNGIKFIDMGETMKKTLSVLIIGLFLFGTSAVAYDVTIDSSGNVAALKWEDVQHVEDGGSTQLARMKDGTFIFLSVGFITAKVVTTLKPESFSDYHEVKSVMILERKSLESFSVQEMLELAQGSNDELNNQLHKENLGILERMRSLIKSPRTAQELADTLMSSDFPDSI